MKLTKNAAVDKVKSELNFLKNESTETVESLLELIKSTLESGEDVLISGFGRFCIRDKHERKGRNPATGEAAILPARRVVTFKWSKKLREKINGD